MDQYCGHLSLLLCLHQLFISNTLNVSRTVLVSEIALFAYRVVRGNLHKYITDNNDNDQQSKAESYSKSLIIYFESIRKKTA